MKEIYRILSGALGQEQRLAQIANNLANANTVGFKKDGGVFTDFLKQQLEDQAQATGKPNTTPIDPAQPVWPTLSGNYINQSQGTFQMTKRPLDVALDGPGFFQVKVAGEKQPLYTRAGNFQIDTNGLLQTADGKPVLNEGGSTITIDPLQISKVHISATGDITAGSNNYGKLGVVAFTNPGRMEKVGNGLLRPAQGDLAQPSSSTRVQQGALEGSNVNPIDEMVQMIQTERAYQAAQKAMATIDEAMQRRTDAAN